MIPAMHQLPDGIEASLNLIASFDQCFLVGFANLDRQHQQTLSSLQRVFIGTPFQQPLNDACTAIQNHQFIEKHFATLAAVRAALQGVFFDTLQQQVREGLGRAVTSVSAEEGLPHLPNPAHPLLASVRQWLMEIALVGYARLDTSTVLPFMATLELLQKEPLLIRSAALLTGFINELLNQIPIDDSSTIPIYRWMDLWTRAMISSPTPVTDNAHAVSGKLEVVGLDLRHHANLVSLIFYGLLTTNEQEQLVRVNFSAYKVDAIASDEIWLLFPNAVLLLDAFSQNTILHLDNVPLLPTGDLVWNGQAAIADQKYNLMKRVAQCFTINATKVPTLYSIHPIARHPIQLAEPIFLDGYTITHANNTLSLSGAEVGMLPIAIEQMSPFSEVTEEAIANSTQLFGLLRFDAGRWAVQPLAITVKGKTIFTGQKAATILKSPPKSSTVSILQERASRLLRKG